MRFGEFTFYWISVSEVNSLVHNNPAEESTIRA